MNALRTASKPDAAPGTEPRRDLRQRDIVDEALALLPVVGTLSALEYLKRHEVSGSVIARVLLDPARRHATRGLRAV